MDLVFVYGSLKRGLLHHDQLDGAVYAGQAEVARHRLVVFEECYPALTPAHDSTATVKGELYLVPGPLLKKLDAFEDVPVLYQRSLVPLCDGRRAWAYVIDSERASRYPGLEGPWKERGPRT